MVVKNVEEKKIIDVILLFIESFKFPKKEYNKKPIVIGLINLKRDAFKLS
jgi:hypothetical protein